MRTTSATNTFLKYLRSKLTTAQLSGVTSLWLSLHTASPASGNQQTSETDYVGYARVEITHDNGVLSIAAGSLSIYSDIRFPVCTDGEERITHWGLGTTEAATGTLLLSGEINPDLVVTEGIDPQLVAFNCIAEVNGVVVETADRALNAAVADAIVAAKVTADANATTASTAAAAASAAAAAVRAGSLRVYATCAALRADTTAPTLNPFAYVLGVGFFARGATAGTDDGTEAATVIIISGDTAGQGFVKQANPAVA